MQELLLHFMEGALGAVVAVLALTFKTGKGWGRVTLRVSEMEHRQIKMEEWRDGAMKTLDRASTYSDRFTEKLIEFRERLGKVENDIEEKLLPRREYDARHDAVLMDIATLRKDFERHKDWHHQA